MDSRLKIICGNIASQKVEAIINPSDLTLLEPSDISSQIHQMAGPALKLECKAISSVSVGDAKITSAYNLYSQYVIHSVCPDFVDGQSGEEKLLESCYKSCFSRVSKLRMRSIAIPVLGINKGFDVQHVIDIAIKQTQKFLKKADLIDRVLLISPSEKVHSKLLVRFNAVKLLDSQKKIFRNESELQSCISQFSILTNVNRVDFSDIDLVKLSSIFHSGPLTEFIPPTQNNILKHQASINKRGDYCYTIDDNQHTVPAPYLPLVHFIFDHFSHTSEIVKLPKQKVFHLLWDYVDDIVSWATNLDTSLYSQSFQVIKEIENARLEIFHGIQKLKPKFESDPLYDEIKILPDLIFTLTRLLISRGVNLNLKIDILLALIYVVSPVDFIPEGFVEHPIAYMDDLAICYLVFNKAVNKYKLHPKILSREWHNTPEKLLSLKDDYQRVLEVMDPELIDLIWGYLHINLSKSDSKKTI
ncbi:MAG: macro domain-containing protein [Candidatus Cloacimonetes bacterium]|nr:macro domain-containing protein [Candidatus Cloacimonadota bacterium]